MKLTIVLLTVGFMNVYAVGVSQNVSFSGRNVSLESVFKSVKKQTGFVFMYTEALLKSAKPVSITAENIPLEEFLAEIFKSQPLQFDIKGKSVFISPKPDGFPQRSPLEKILRDTLMDVSGRIVNEKGEPAAATVTVKGTKKGASTNEEGFFKLNNVESKATLFITGIGIQPREIKLNGNRELSTIVVSIRTTAIDEIQVIAYGTTSKRFLVGAVSTVKAETIEKQPVSNVLLALQGRVPGLIIKPSSGIPGSTVTLQVRGQNTLYSTSNYLPFDQPLIIIDGVPFAPQNQVINMVASAGNSNYVGSGSPFGGYGAISSINPNDIESITVLRDADATSIYGSQGANGVILIKTKRGVPGETNFNVRINTGPNQVTRRYKYLNTQQYLELRREAIVNDGLTLPAQFNGEYPDLQLFDTTRNIDWFDTFFGGTSNNTDIQTSLTGGTENTSFLLSAGYNKSKFNFPGNFAAIRLSLHSGFQYKSKNNKLTIDFGTDYSYSKTNSSQTPDATAVNKLPPDAPEMLDDNGNLIWTYKGFDLGTSFSGNNIMYYQQYAYLKQPYDLKTYNLLNSVQFNYKLIGGFSATINLGYSRSNSSENSQYPIGSQSPNQPFGREAIATFAKNDFETFNAEPQLNFQQAIGAGQFIAVAGTTYKINNNIGERITGAGYTNDGFLGSLTGAGRIVEALSHNTVYKYIGVFGRASYIYRNKYIINLTGRRDGSSNFGPGKQFGTFASAGGGWIISEEKIFSKWKSVMSLLKISANYGTNGSDGVSPYNYQDYWTVPQFTISPPFQGFRPYSPANLFNPDYSWALKKSLNLMLDVELFEGKMLANVIWYRNRTGNQLVDVMLPSQTGFQGVIDNLGATVQNAGWEITIASTNIKTKNFSWTSNFNYSLNRNKLIAFPDLDKSAYTGSYVIGQSTSMVPLWKYKGVNETTGLFEFYNAKGELTSNPNYDFPKDGGDRIASVDLQPGFTGGLENTISYKSFSLSVFFQFAKQTASNYLYAVYGGGYFPGMHGNMPALVENRWRKPGDQAPLQRASTGSLNDPSAAASFFLGSTGVYGDASYLRLKTLAVSYDFPAPLIKKIGMQNLRVYANIQNLLTITGYEFSDPEQPGLLTFPLQKAIAIGLMFNF